MRLCDCVFPLPLFLLVTGSALQGRRPRGPQASAHVITHLEPDILESKVKRALESITMNKASGGDGIPVEQFQILKDDAVKVLHSICQHIWKTQQCPQYCKSSVFIPIPNKGNAKECSNALPSEPHYRQTLYRLSHQGSHWT